MAEYLHQLIHQVDVDKAQRDRDVARVSIKIPVLSKAPAATNLPASANRDDLRGGTASYTHYFDTPPPLPYQRPPASPTAPGFTSIPDVEGGPNVFRLGIDGRNPELAVGGTTAQQDHQRDETSKLVGPASISYISGHIPGIPRVPPDGKVATILESLRPNPPIGRDGNQVTHAIYQSHIPNATAAQAYQHFVDDPAAVFGAGGMQIRPSTSHLTNGGRYMLEIGGPTPTWLPVQINLNSTADSISIETLDGHVLRGQQTFTFTDDGRGGTVLTQDAHFQASSQLVGDVQQLTSVASGQHQAWQFAHREIYEYFNGNPGYKGMGTGVFNEQQRSSWKEALENTVRHPGTAVEVGPSVLGQIAASGMDRSGDYLQRCLDQLGASGAGVIVNQDVHKAGDVVAAGGHVVGVGAKNVLQVPHEAGDGVAAAGHFFRAGVHKLAFAPIENGLKSFP